VRKGVLQAGEAVGEEAGVGGVIGIKLADTAENIAPGAVGAISCVATPVADVPEPGGLLVQLLVELIMIYLMNERVENL
jgi:hypothetical protein